jgi:hypothetical protein
MTQCKYQRFQEVQIKRFFSQIGEYFNMVSRGRRGGGAHRTLELHVLGATLWEEAPLFLCPCSSFLFTVQKVLVIGPASWGGGEEG